MGNQASLSSFQKDLGIPINFQEESGLIIFEALNSTSLWKCQELWGPLSRWGGELGFSPGSPQRIQTSLHLERWKTILHSSHFREIRPYSSQRISVFILLEAGKSGSLSHNYCSGKAPLEVLLESWPTCSIESWESYSVSTRFRLNRAFLEFLCWNLCS